MIVQILNYLAASHLLASEPAQWSAIVILDSRGTATDFVAQTSVEHLILRFDDITTPSSGKQMADPRSLRAALDFAVGKDKLIVSCRAGQSRSAALAHAICFQNNGADAANQLLIPARHQPNRFIIEAVAELIDDPTYLSTFDAWSNQYGDIKLMDHIDEIEAEFDALEALGARNLITAT